MKGSIFPIPENAPKIGENYLHYKGGSYEIVGIALHSNDEWVVVYKPLYENPVGNLFTRPLREWFEEIEWKGVKKRRFTLNLK